MTVTENDLHAAMLIPAAAREERYVRGLPESVLAGLHELVPCEWVNIIDYSPRSQVAHYGCAYPLADDASDPDPAGWWAQFWAGPCSYGERTGDVYRARTLSDTYADRQFLDSPLYADYLRYLGVRAEISVYLKASPERSVKVLFSRTGAVDFTDRDRLLLELLRPHLAELYRQPTGRDLLTPRQQQLLDLVASGMTNDQAARRLGIAEGTARKHLEQIFDRLGVASRAAAVVTAAAPARNLNG